MPGSNPGAPANAPGATAAPAANAPAPDSTPTPSSPPTNDLPTTRPSTSVAPPDPEVVAATAVLDDAVAKVKSALMSNPDYAAALAAKKAARDEAAALHDGEDSHAGDIVAIAHRGLEAGQKATAIEREAMAKDPAVTAARARLDAAIVAARNSAK